MYPQTRWGRVITGDDQDIGIQRKQLRHRCIHSFNESAFAGKVTIFALAVCLLDMNKEEIVIIPNSGKRSELILVWFHPAR